MLTKRTTVLGLQKLKFNCRKINRQNLMTCVQLNQLEMDNLCTTHLLSNHNLYQKESLVIIT